MPTVSLSSRTARTPDASSCAIARSASNPDAYVARSTHPGTDMVLLRVLLWHRRRALALATSRVLNRHETMSRRPKTVDHALVVGSSPVFRRCEQSSNGGRRSLRRYHRVMESHARPCNLHAPPQTEVSTMTTAVRPSIQTRYRAIDGLSIRYAESEPRDEHALLLSPWPESIYAYESIWSRLAERMHLVAVDLPGFGQSERRDALMSPRAMGEFIVRIADAFELENPHVVGPDIGTGAALFAAALHPGR